MASSSTSPQTVILRSSDGEIFTIPKSTAALSVTIANSLEESFGDSIIPITNVDSQTLGKVITYLNKHAESDVSDEEKKKFDDEFLSRQATTDLFVIIMAANFLNIKDLIGAVSQKIADVMKNKTVKWVRKMFQIENDFTPDEEEQVKEENAWTFEDIELDDDDDDDDDDDVKQN